MLTLLHSDMWLQTYFDHADSSVILSGGKKFKKLINKAMRENRRKITVLNGWQVNC